MKSKYIYILFFIFISFIICSCKSLSSSSSNNSNSTISNSSQQIEISNIVLSCDKQEIVVDEEVQLTYQIFPNNATNKSIKFISNNNSVATVTNEGLVKGMGKGEATITIISNNQVSDSINIRVIDNSILVTSVSIENKIDTIYQDDTYSLICKILPNDATDKTLIFSSSIPSIASIDDTGKITARLPGTTTISVLSNDRKQKDSFELIVKKKIINVESIDLKCDKTSLVEGETIKLDVTILPDNASNKDVLFYSLTPNYISVNNEGYVTALSPTPNNVYAIVEAKSMNQEKTAQIQFTIKKKNISVEAIDLVITNDTIIPGDIVNYEVTITPSNADNKTYVLTTSTIDILSIDSDTNKVTALKEGIGKLTITSNDGNKSSTIDVIVLATSTYSEIKSLLDVSLDIERESAISGNYNYVRSGLINSSTSITWTVYEDAIQKREINDYDTFTELNYINGSSIYTLTDSLTNNVSLTDRPIGNETWEIPENEANDSTKLVNISDSLGLSSFIKTLLDDTSSFSLSGEENNFNKLRIIVTKDNNFKYVSIVKECEYKSLSYDNNVNYLSLSSLIIFNLDSSISSFEYVIEKYDEDAYDQTKHELRDNAVPSNKEEGNAYINYDKRLSSDENRISTNDYKVTSFEIDTSNLIDDNNEISLYLGEVKNINLTNILPIYHLTPTYTLEIEDSSIIQDVSNYNVLTIKGLKLGTTNIKVISDTGVEREIDITVKVPPVNNISINYINPLIYVGDSFKISASVYPIDALDLSYTMEIKEGNDVASLSKNNDGSYTFAALKEGSVTIIAYSNENPNIKDEETLNIKKVADSSSIKTAMCSSRYYFTDSELSFNEDGTGTLKLQGGGEYSFNWDVSSSLQITFTNIIATKVPDKWYDFRGAYGSMVLDQSANEINLIVYDLDIEGNALLRFSH